MTEDSSPDSIDSIGKCHSDHCRSSQAHNAHAVVLLCPAAGAAKPRSGHLAAAQLLPKVGLRHALRRRRREWGSHRSEGRRSLPGRPQAGSLRRALHGRHRGAPWRGGACTARGRPQAGSLGLQRVLLLQAQPDRVQGRARIARARPPCADVRTRPPVSARCCVCRVAQGIGAALALPCGRRRKIAQRGSSGASGVQPLQASWKTVLRICMCRIIAYFIVRHFGSCNQQTSTSDTFTSTGRHLQAWARRQCWHAARLRPRQGWRPGLAPARRTPDQVPPPAWASCYVRRGGRGRARRPRTRPPLAATLPPWPRARRALPRTARQPLPARPPAPPQPSRRLQQGRWARRPLQRSAARLRQG